jgi:Ni/Fe-hydrogenase subunit HybB-like protein
MSILSLDDVNRTVLDALKPPPLRYYLLLLALAGCIGTFFMVWLYQIKTGMGVAGISWPVGWGVYIGNFVFWVGIAHSGTLISAILKLVRAKWRNAVSRSAEAMTVFAVMTAGLFPLIHLGRVWVFYFILPYPSERHLWPNFVSPLIWDVLAVSTYLTVSTIFFYVGMIPDLAAARDRWTRTHGPGHPRTAFFRTLSLGWTGSGKQWAHYGRGYLFFAALATPLVVSVHSVVSWDFAMALLQGWHTTILAPYFVAGAIHSGLAMVLTLIIPLRKILHLEQVITVDHMEAVAKTMLVTTCIVAAAYIIEPFMDWYSGAVIDRQYLAWFTGGWIAGLYWVLPFLVVLPPLLFVFRRMRRNIALLFIASIVINIGMWLERVFIVISGTAHDYLPHVWGSYLPTWVEDTITLGSFTFFFFLFIVFSKTLPVVPMSEYKEDLAGEKEPPEQDAAVSRSPDVKHERGGILALFDAPELLQRAIESLRGTVFDRFETYAPIHLESAARSSGRAVSPVRLWTLFGALAGIAGGFALAAGTASVNMLVVGGKPPVSFIPFCIVGFEGGVLLGSIANLAGLIVHARLGRFDPPPWYDPRFSVDRYGLFVACAPETSSEAASLLEGASPEEVRYVPQQ